MNSCSMHGEKRSTQKISAGNAFGEEITWEANDNIEMDIMD